MSSDLYTIIEVANLLSLHVKTVRRYVQEGRLKSVRFGKQYRIARADLEAFMGRKLDGEAATEAPLTAEVSSTIDINGINPDKARRLTTLIGAAIKGRNKNQGLKVETLYDDSRARLRIIILGSLETTSVLFGMIEHIADTKND